MAGEGWSSLGQYYQQQQAAGQPMQGDKISELFSRAILTAFGGGPALDAYDRGLDWRNPANWGPATTFGQPASDPAAAPQQQQAQQPVSQLMLGAMQPQAPAVAQGVSQTPTQTNEWAGQQQPQLAQAGSPTWGGQLSPFRPGPRSASGSDGGKASLFGPPGPQV